MDTPAIIGIEEVVTRYLLKYKLPSTDYYVYLEHACDVISKFQVRDGNKFRSEKVSVSALGIIEFPSDCIRVKEPCVARNGEWWPMTERPNLVNTTTMTGLVEGHDANFGEGVAVLDNLTYSLAAKGAVNSYYYMIDYNARRIFCDGIISDTALLKYVSSGISITATTYIPEMLIPLVDTYLLWKETYWRKDLARERASREDNFKNERLEIRNVLNGLTASQWQDLIWGSTSQNPKR
jgi:hypothetical protein